MGKKLSEMSLEDLWRLFPIFLKEHRDCWNEWYEEERILLNAILPKAKINHIGSTAVKGIWAKPIVDILAELPTNCNLSNVGAVLIDNGYMCMAKSESRMSFNKGYTENGFAEKVFHLHLRYNGDNDELYFRDYLNEFPDVARAYEQMKLKLWKEYEHDRDGYTNAKCDFVRKYTAEAKEMYKGRY